MTTLHRFSRADLMPTPWKNGGGTTREIACWPPGASMENFDWRVSIATIAASGPFSIFEGVDRTIMLLDGDGVHLQGEALDHCLDRAHQPFNFSGDVPLDCSLLGGASSDFNVMSRRARCHADIAIIESAQPLHAAQDGLLFALRGRWQAGDERLNTGEGLWWANQDRSWPLDPLTPGAKLIAVRWSRPTTT